MYFDKVVRNSNQEGISLGSIGCNEIEWAHLVRLLALLASFSKERAYSLMRVDESIELATSLRGVSLSVTYIS